jgi:hypothetical protein
MTSLPELYTELSTLLSRTGQAGAPGLHAAIREIAMRLRTVDSDTLFHALFPTATCVDGTGADIVAAMLLAELEPFCPVSCEDALRILANGAWQPSDYLVPYYLVTQFGQRLLRTTCNTLAAQLEEPQSRVVWAVGYQASWGTLSAIEGFAYNRVRACRAWQEDSSSGWRLGDLTACEACGWPECAELRPPTTSVDHRQVDGDPPAVWVCQRCGARRLLRGALLS